MSRDYFKGMARRVKNYLTNEMVREHGRLVMKWGGTPRYTTREKVRFLEYSFTVPDLPTFIAQFEEIFLNECYKFKSTTTKPVIIDCGANIGMSCLYFNKRYPISRIMAFEADPKIFSVLKSNLHNNGVENVELIEAAVWINGGEIDFAVEGADSGSIHGKQNMTKVKCTRLKDFLEKFFRVDLLKIDIEGAEYEVITDCKDILGNVENIFVEYHSWNSEVQRLGEILSVLEMNGFRYFLEVPDKRGSPLVNHGENQTIDMHTNIYGWRNK